MRSQAEILASDPDGGTVLKGMSEEEVASLLYHWPFWARPNQLEPEGDWLTWLAMAGRGYGKTRQGAEWVRKQMCGDTPLGKSNCERMALVAETAADGRDVLVEGESGLLAIHPPDFRPHYEPSKRRLTWRNGATATIYNGTEPDQLRGPQQDGAWVDELAKYRYADETYSNLMFGLRLGTRPRKLVTTTPRPIPIIKSLLADPTTVTTRGSTYDNLRNLAPSFIVDIRRKFEGTRLGRQELHAEVLDDVPGALWTRKMLEECRRPALGTNGELLPLPEMQRVVVAIDPPGSSKKPEDTEDISTAECGIVVAGLGTDGRGYVIADGSCSLPPSGWARRAVSLFDQYDADAIVIETNYGGEMASSTVKAVRDGIKVLEVHASRGKVVRAEPIAALYEQGRVSHIGAFPAVEDQLVMFTPFGVEGDGKKDRADALVWALSSLFKSLIRVRPAEAAEPAVYADYSGNVAGGWMGG